MVGYLDDGPFLIHNGEALREGRPMSFAKLILATAVCSLPFASLSIPARAATTHNEETGANTKNSNDPGMMANKMSPTKMKMKMMKKKRMMHMKKM